MSKFRIIEVKEPLRWGYVKGAQDEPPKDIVFSATGWFLQERKSIFHKWKTVTQIDSILEAEFYIYNRKAEKTKAIERVIKEL